MRHRNRYAIPALAATTAALAGSCAGNDGAIQQFDGGAGGSVRGNGAPDEAGLDGWYAEAASAPSGGSDVAVGASSETDASSESGSSSGGHREAGLSGDAGSSSGSGSGSNSGSGSGSGSGSASVSGSGSASVSCTWGTAYNGNGSFTWYYFGQGTSQSGGRYKTACGYAGTESGSGPTAVDTVDNVANTPPSRNTYFAAIPGASPGTFDTVTSCGACVEITGMNKVKIVATIVDECPRNSNPLCTADHLDLSTQAFSALGYPVGNPSGTTWKFVPCPVTGNIVAVPNSANQFYLQNSVYPVTAVNGVGPSNWGYFNVSPGNVTITSGPAGKTISGSIPSGGGDTRAQFSAVTGCY